MCLFILVIYVLVDSAINKHWSILAVHLVDLHTLYIRIRYTSCQTPMTLISDFSSDGAEDRILDYEPGVL